MLGLWPLYNDNDYYILLQVCYGEMDISEEITLDASLLETPWYRRYIIMGIVKSKHRLAFFDTTCLPPDSP